MPPEPVIAREADSSRARALFAAHAVMLCLLSLHLVSIERHLFADGSHFVWSLLESKTIFAWFPARRFSHMLTQLPVVFAMRVLNCRDLRLLSTLYGGTLFVVPIAGLLATAWAGRKGPANFLLMPLLCVSGLMLTTSFVIFHEAWVGVALFWCALSLLSHTPRMTAARGAALVVVSALATRTFESYLFLALPLAAAAGLRFRAALKGHARFDMAMCTTSLAINAAGAILAAWEILDPRDKANRSTFLAGLRAHLEYPPVVLTVAFLLAFFVFALCPRTPRTRRAAMVVGVVLAAAALGVGLSPFYAPHLIQPAMQYVARAQFVYFPFLLGALAVALAHGPGAWRARFIAERRDLWGLTAGLTLAAVLFHVGAGREWQRFRDALGDDIANDRGVVPFESSVLGTSRTPNGARLTRFDWGWTTPTLSALSGALTFGKVGTVIENERPVGWEPFDPHDVSAYHWLEEFGVQVRIGMSPPPVKEAPP